MNEKEETEIVGTRETVTTKKLDELEIEKMNEIKEVEEKQNKATKNK